MPADAAHAAEVTRPRLLVCDDDAKVLESVRRLLLSRGFEAVTAQSGTAALEELARNSYDLLLLDLNMPDCDGYFVLDRIRAAQYDTAVVIVSGESSIDGAVDCLRRGAQDYLRKPYLPEDLFGRVETAWRERRLMRQHRLVQQQMRESERLHRFFVDNAPDFIYLVDTEGRFVYVNESVERLLGFTRDGLAGQHYSRLVHPEDQVQAALVFAGTESTAREGRQGEVRLLHRNGNEGSRTFEFSSQRVSLGLAGGAPHGVYGVARDISERKRAEEIIRFQSSHDLLTRLPNRALFKDRIGVALAQAQRSGQPLAVVYLDLDRFKLVNDTLGHMVGDELLQSVSQRMKNLLRESDTLARVGGDEFLLLLPSLANEDSATLVANKLIRELERPFNVSQHQLYVTASAGIAMSPRDGTNADTLIRKADAAMYAAKAGGRHGYRHFSPEMELEPQRRLMLGNDLKRAIDTGQLRLHYQPQVDVRGGNIIGVEALLRWQHPEHGLLPPSEFLPIVEESGLSGPIGQWVLETACSDLQNWQAMGVAPRMAINFSSSQVERHDFVPMILSTLRQTRLPAGSLEVELTEESMIKDVGTVVGKLARLADAGVRVAIDDFGIGYSSLSYLRKLPIHTLKIDRSFVQDIRSEREQGSLVSAIVSMAAGLRLNTIAEGVETEAQMRFLHTQGCHEMQGFLFSRAVDANTTADLLRARAMPSVRQSF